MGELAELQEAAGHKDRLTPSGDRQDMDFRRSPFDNHAAESLVLIDILIDIVIVIAVDGPEPAEQSIRIRITMPQNP